MRKYVGELIKSDIGKTIHLIHENVGYVGKLEAKILSSGGVTLEIKLNRNWTERFLMNNGAIVDVR